MAQLGTLLAKDLPGGTAAAEDGQRIAAVGIVLPDHRAAAEVIEKRQQRLTDTGRRSMVARDLRNGGRLAHLEDQMSGVFVTAERRDDGELALAGRPLGQDQRLGAEHVFGEQLEEAPHQLLGVERVGRGMGQVAIEARLQLMQPDLAGQARAFVLHPLEILAERGAEPAVVEELTLEGGTRHRRVHGRCTFSVVRTPVQSRGWLRWRIGAISTPE